MNNKYNKQKTALLILTTLIILSTIFAGVLNLLISVYKNNIKNTFYIDIVNMTLPIYKVQIYNDETISESTSSIKDRVLDILGLNLSDPVTVLAREESIFSLTYASEAKETSVSVQLTPYVLSDSKVTKIQTPAPASTTPNLSEVFAKSYDPALKKATLSATPEVLIYHTHTSESYSPAPPDTTDQSMGVCAVGDELQKILQDNYNISTINDKTVHDQVAYTQSYDRSAETLDKYLKKYGDFKLIIDLHRDSIENKNQVTKSINGENVAKFGMVMCLKNPHYAKNNIMATKIETITNKLFPGLFLQTIPYNYGTRFFNQDKSNNAVLIEVGSNVNTIDEAKNTSKYIARVIAEILNR